MIPGSDRRDPLAGFVDVIVIGAGHSGLAMSCCLAERSIEHVVLERGEIAGAWRERWDSLRLLTPNWQSRLPGYRYDGPDPDGYMTRHEVVEFVQRYARHIGAPVRGHTAVTSICADGDGGYAVSTERGRWGCRAVVLASGAHRVPVVPPAAQSLPAALRTLTPNQYKRPDELDPGGVLVVGASATGLQLADEIHRSGRRVVLAVGEHIRMPRLYRGLDIQSWLDGLGILDERYDEVEDIVRARRVPSPQLVGSAERATLDLNALTERGVEIVGRLVGVDGGRLQFSGSLRNHCAMADLKLDRLLGRIDAWAEETGKDAAVGPPERYTPTCVADAPRLTLDLKGGGIATVVWATGFRPDYSCLHVPVFDAKGRVEHDGGVIAAPGLYTLGLNFLRRRKSSFMHGAEDDARDLCVHLAAYLGACPATQSRCASRPRCAAG